MSTRGKQPDFVCPNCGADVAGGSTHCPECGSDERTGWSDDTYLDGVSLPWSDDDEVTESVPSRGGVLSGFRWVWALVAAVILAASALIVLAPYFRG